jgi:hypothetical protein
LELNLLVTETLGRVIIFKNILNDKLNNFQTLIKSNETILTAAIIDINNDGKNNILIGTFTKELLIFEYDKEKNEYKILKKIKFPFPVYSIKQLDIDRDGILEIIIIT